MLVLFVVFVPIISGISSLLLKHIQTQLVNVGRGQFFIMAAVALLISIGITWRYYRAPESYHRLTITPIVSQDQKIELIEIKANGDIVRLDNKTVSEAGWQIMDDVLVASSQSKPLVISFKATLNSPVILLFYTTSESGRAGISLENEQTEIELISTENRQKSFTFQAHTYRGVPNSIFIPFLIITDIFSFGSLILFMLFLQEIGQKGMEQTKVLNFFSHRVSLLILLTISSILHLINALAVPLLLDVDSPSHIAGALHLIESGNLDGVSMIRGPGSTFLFAPVLFLFGRNPWGIKIFLHLMAIACVPLSYRIGWQLGKNRWIAFASGLVTALSPDLFLYSNYLMSDLPNVFLVLIFCTAMISALKNLDARWIIAAALIGSFAALFRSENVALLLIGAGALILSILWRWWKGSLANVAVNLRNVAFAFVLAALPLLWWSAHNQKAYGFFGLSNYAGEVFYDGWIYFGDASGLSFTDQSSPAVKQINSAIEKYPIATTDPSGTPTGWEIYPSLLKAGYTTEQAFNLFQSAAWDSIKKNKSLAAKLLFIKIEDGLTPGTTHMLTLPLPEEDFQTPKMGYFDQENLSIPLFINMQREFNKHLQKWYDTVFPYWVYLCLFAMILSLARSPRAIWITLILITATRIFIPNIMGLSHWRYTIAGLIPLQIIAVNFLAVLIHAAISVFKRNHIADNLNS